VGDDQTQRAFWVVDIGEGGVVDGVGHRVALGGRGVDLFKEDPEVLCNGLDLLHAATKSNDAGVERGKKLAQCLGLVSLGVHGDEDQLQLGGIGTKALFERHHLGEVSGAGVGAIQESEKHQADFSWEACGCLGLAIEIRQAEGLSPGGTGDVHAVERSGFLCAAHKTNGRGAGEDQRRKQRPETKGLESKSHPLILSRMTNCPRIEIIGLGLAGACMLHALAKARFEGVVQVFEQASGPAQQASGNPLGIVHPLISADHNRASQFFDDGLQVCMDWCHVLEAEQLGWASFCGVIEEGTCRLGGWIQPVSFVQACLQSACSWFGARLEVHFNTPAPSVTHGVRVVCSASPEALPDAGLCLRPIAGQVSWVQACPEEGPSMVLCGSGYVAPVVCGQLLVGASFERESLSTEVTQQGHAENFERLMQLDRGLAARMRARWPQAQGRAAVRWATRDRMPLIGQPVDRAALQAHPYPQRISQLEHLPRQAHTFVLMGLGSRGLSTAPLGATMIVHQILGEPSPLPRELVDAVDPARFVLREHRRTGRWPEAHYSI